MLPKCWLQWCICAASPTTFDLLSQLFFFFLLQSMKNLVNIQYKTTPADFGASTDYLPLIQQQRQKSQTLVYSCEWQDKMVQWNKHSLSRSAKPDRNDISGHVHSWWGIKLCEVSDKTMLHRFVQVGHMWDIELAEGGVIFYFELDCTSTCSCATIHKNEQTKKKNREREWQTKYDVF